MPVDLKIKTPFRYPGGKYYALKYILPYIEKIPHDEYREPFVGGGSVFFGKDKAKANWINDIEPEIINIYKHIQDEGSLKVLLDKFSSEIADKIRYAEIKAIKPVNDLERAFKYYYLNRTSFSGKLVSPAWGYREKRSIPPHRWHEVLIPVQKKLADVKITNIDFEKVINAKSDYKKVLLYLDPPYFLPPKTKHYLNGFTKIDHDRLRDSLMKTRYSFLLSYEDCPEIRQMYSWAHIYRLAFTYRVGDSNTSESKRLTGNEVIVSNIDMQQMEQLKIF